MPRAKYKKRPDGRRETTKLYKDFGNTHYCGRKHFYGSTDAEIDAKIAAFEQEQLEAPDSHVVLFSVCAEKWWDKKQDDISPNSINNYRKAKERAVEQFGDRPVAEIRPRDCLNYLYKYTDLSQKTIGNTRTVLKEILDVALIDELIEVNPCISLPRVKGSTANKRPRKPAPEEDVQILTEHRFESIQSRFYYFILWTGLRRSEAVALKWKDIDLKRNVVHVRRQIYFDGPNPHEKAVKSEAGERSVELIDSVIDVLPERTADDKYIWFPDGIPTEKRLETWLREFQKEHGLTAMPHQYRHSYASMLHSAEIDVKDAQHLLGHSTVAMTQDVYTHLERQHKAKLQRKIDSYQKNLATEEE